MRDDTDTNVAAEWFAVAWSVVRPSCGHRSAQQKHSLGVDHGHETTARVGMGRSAVKIGGYSPLLLHTNRTVCEVRA